MESAIEIQKLVKTYQDGELVLDSLDLEVPAGPYLV
jgi:hypothetical protein